MSILKKKQSTIVGAMGSCHPAAKSKFNRLSLDVGAVVNDPKSLEKHRYSLESGLGSLSTITSPLSQEDSAGDVADHPDGPSSEPYAELNVSKNSSLAASMGCLNDFGGSNGPEEVETSRESSNDLQHRGSDRSPSNFSELSLAGTECSLSARTSIDSAIFMEEVTKRTRRASLTTNRISMYSVISSDTIYEMPESSINIEEGNPLQVTDNDVNVQVSNVQSTVTSCLQAKEEAPVECITTTDKPKISRLVKFIRFILRIVNTCIQTQQDESDIETASFDYLPEGDHNAAILGHNEDAGYHNCAFTEEVVRVEANHTLADNKTGFIHDFTIERKTFLESFEWMLEQAKEQGIDVVGHNFQIANFAAAILDCRGGCLSIDDLDVHLYVPPGAIPIKKQQQVYIFVTGASSVDNHFFLTPFVHCGPPDTTFEEDVILTMPHCVKDTTSCKFSLSKLSSGGSCELREGSDVITVVDNDSITFSVNHFCGFGASASSVDGTILKKSMIACVFIREDSHSDDEVTLRLRLVDEDGVSLLKVKTEERKYGFHLADVESPLIVQKTDQDVVTKILNCSKTWKISDLEPCQRKIHRDLLWPKNEASRASAFPSVMFLANRCSGSEKVPFKAHIKVYQEGSACYGVTFPVEANKQRVCPLCESDQEPMKNIQQRLLAQLKFIEVDDTERPTGSRLLQEPTFSKLCALLDTTNPMGNDWRKIHSLLLKTSNCCSENSDSIRDKAGRERRSPTKIVLDMFFGKQSGKKKEETMNVLKRALYDMTRPDAKFAVDAIEEQLIKWSETRQGCSTSTPHNHTKEVTTDENANQETDVKALKNYLRDSAYETLKKKKIWKAVDMDASL